jgi:hypothetical protein
MASFLLSIVFGSLYGAIAACAVNMPMLGAVVGAVVGCVLSPAAVLCLRRKSLGDSIGWVFVPMTGVAVLLTAAAGLFATVGIVFFYAFACAVGEMLLRDRSAHRAGVCPTCGYSLAGLAVSTCPECGADPTETGLSN